MLLGVIGIPQLSLLDLRLAAHQLNYEVANLVWAGLTLKLTSYPLPGEERIDARPLLVHSVDALVKGYTRLEKDRRRYIVLCSSSLSELYEYEIPVYKNGDSSFLSKDLKRIVGEALKEKSWNEPLQRVRDLAEITLKEVNKDSLLGKLLTSFYRVKDKEERSRVQDAVYNFLGGKKLVGQVPSYIQTTLESELATRFREAVKQSIQTGDLDRASVEKQIDRFEIAFVLAKTRPKQAR